MKAYRLFDEPEAREMAEALKSMEWTPGKAGKSVIVTKSNEELKGSAVKVYLDEIRKRIVESPIPALHFVDDLTPIKFNRYREGGEYSLHADAAVMHGLRTDLACTLFLSDDYDGGELCVMGHEVKLKPGECMVYECWRPHFVKPVTRGERIAAILWMQSYIRSEEQRDVLGILRSVIGDVTDEKQYAKLGVVHEKLVKMWWA